MASKMNPLDGYLDAKEKRAAQRNEQDVQMWQTWKQDPTPQTLKPLLDRFQPTFNRSVSNWKAPNVSESAFRGHMTRLAIGALDNYDPNRGASLSTHVTNRLRKAIRFNTQNQNMSYIPEEKAKYIGPINAARDHLRDEFGRDPSDAEIGAHIGLKPKLVTEIKGLQRADLHASRFESDPVGHAGSRDEEVIGLLHLALGPEERQVFNYIYGREGNRQVTETGEIARLLGKSPSHVSRIKNRIAAEYKKYV